MAVGGEHHRMIDVRGVAVPLVLVVGLAVVVGGGGVVLGQFDKQLETMDKTNTAQWNAIGKMNTPLNVLATQQAVQAEALETLEEAQKDFREETKDQLNKIIDKLSEQ